MGGEDLRSSNNEMQQSTGVIAIREMNAAVDHERDGKELICSEKDVENSETDRIVRLCEGL